jgi:hypothetical protein
MKAIPVKYISSVDIQLRDKTTCSIDVSDKLRNEWKNNLDEASKQLEEIIFDIDSSHGVNLVEYILDFDLMKTEISFTSSRLGNENNSNND